MDDMSKFRRWFPRVVTLLFPVLVIFTRVNRSWWWIPWVFGLVIAVGSAVGLRERRKSWLVTTLQATGAGIVCGFLLVAASNFLR